MVRDREAPGSNPGPPTTFVHRQYEPQFVDWHDLFRLVRLDTGAY